MKKKSKDRSQPKPKEPLGAPTEPPSTSSRGGRGRGGFEGTRGGRGRTSDRGRATSRGGRGGLTNGTRANHAAKVDEAPAVENSTWDTPATETATGSWDSGNTESTNLDSSWEHVSTDAVPTPTAEPPKPSSKPDGTRSWASMFSKPAPAPAPAKVPKQAPSHEAPIETSVAVTSIPAATDMVGLPPPPMNETSEIPNTPPASDMVVSDPPANITPSKDELTETNLEQVEDTSGPPLTATAASTVASTIDPQSAAGNQQQSSRPPLGGFATSAYKATGLPVMGGRSASYQRKILEQQEAVVMPGKHAVDRAAVQFGSMGLSGTTDDVDVDSDREDAETRAQPPQHSPIAPRAALPPAPQQQAPQAPIDAHPAPRQAPGLPPLHQQPSMPSQPLPGEAGVPPQPPQSSYPYNNRYGPQAGQQELSAPAQKAYEPFGQQMQQSQYDGYPSSQAQSQPPTQAQAQQGAYSSAANDMPSYYTSDNQRNAYQNSYYGNYGQPSQQNAQDTAPSQQRGGGAFGSSAPEQSSQNPTSGAHSQPQNRYGQTAEAQASGNSTPNPSLVGQPQPNQPHQMLQQQAQGQAGGQHAYPYGHPYHYPSQYYSYMNQVSNNHPYGRDRPMFDDVRRQYDDQYLTHNTQFGYGGGQGGYGGGPFGGTGGKQGMYGQAHQGYGMNPQTSYDQHSSSPANTGPFGQQTASGRDSAVTGSLGSYARSGSAQPSDNQQYSGSGANHHASAPDVFARSSSGYPGQNSGLGSAMGQQGGNEDSLRGFNEPSKVPGGPSPALGQPGGRPGSAANVPGQSGLPPPQGQNQGQQGYGGYMGHQMHGQQGSQYGGGPGGLGGHHQYGGQNHQAGGYGGYGAGYGTSSYGNSNRGGWNTANYGH